MNNAAYWIWLQNCIGVGVNVRKHFEYYSSVSEIYNAGSYDSSISAQRIKKLSVKDLSESERIIGECALRGYEILTPDDAEYPDCFREIDDYPCVIYVKGKFDFNNEPMISMVGARKASKYSLNVATRLSYSLTKGGMTVVSGGALGVDSSSHKGALIAGGNTVMVLGCGLNSGYLKENAALRAKVSENGALISEFSPDTPAGRATFPLRNRLIAALGLGTVVIEANVKSGSLITAKYARDYGRDVFGVPGGIYNTSFEGVNRLLRDGAKAVFGVEDILEEYENGYPQKINLKKALAYDINVQEKNYDELPKTKIEAIDKDIPLDLTPKKQFPSLSAKARLVYDCLEFGNLYVNEICSKTGLSLNEVLSHLTSLELIDAVEAVPGGTYKQK